MSKNNWSQARTDKLVEVILGWEKVEVVTIFQPFFPNPTASIEWWKKNGISKLIYNKFKPTISLNHTMVFVNSGWFKEKCKIQMIQYTIDNSWCVTIFQEDEEKIGWWNWCAEVINESLPLAICLALEKVVEV